MNNISNSMCSKCISGLYCASSNVWRCTISGYKNLPDCKLYRKRPEWFKADGCTCEECSKKGVLTKLED